VALTDKPIQGETPLTDQDLQGLKLPFVKTRAQLSEVEGQNIISGKQWALRSRRSRIPAMLSLEYMQELHLRMFNEVWDWAGQTRSTELQNAFAASVPDIRPQLSLLNKDAVEYWLSDTHISPDEFALRFHHRVVKIHPFRNGNGRHSRLLADLVLTKHFGREPFTWGGTAQLGAADPCRQTYLEGLKFADRGDYAPLMRLCRAS
jgi:Fic-DOC domain mobile mystery protein B